MTDQPPEPRPVVEGVHLEASDENVAEIAALTDLLGGAAGLDGLLADLKYSARPSRIAPLLGRAVHHAWAFDEYDQRDRRWWPQGITTSADAADGDADALVDGRRIVVTTWYAKDVDGDGSYGARLTFLDTETLRYRHVLLVVPVLDADGALHLRPLRVHAGGVVWAGRYLHVAATARGFFTCRVDDILRVPGDDDHPTELGVREGRVASYGHRYVLPVRFAYRAHADEGHEKLRFSFLSLDRRSEPPALIAGEYGRGSQSTRLARFPLDAGTGLLTPDDDGWSRPLALDDGGVVQMQGAVVARGRYHVNVSQGPWIPGSVYVGWPGTLRRHWFAVPMGPEDLTWSPDDDLLWTVTEHPRRRWIVTMRRSWFD